MKNRSVIIAGGDGDLGFGCVNAYLKLGYKVAVIDKKNTNKIFYKKNKILFLKSTSLNEKKIKLIFNKIKKKFGSPYILLNCAGIFSSKNIVQVSKKDINHIFDVNVTLPTLLIKNFISLKLRDKSVGKIINIGSMAGQNGGEFAGELYSMSKASIINLTKSIAKKFGKKNIFCNCINPGPIETSMTKNWPSKIKTNLIKKFKINKKSLGSIDDIVNICVFLSSEKNNFIQGAEINANGGLII